MIVKRLHIYERVSFFLLYIICAYILISCHWNNLQNGTVKKTLELVQKILKSVS